MIALVQEIDKEIARLQKARELLLGAESQTASSPAPGKARKTRVLSPEARQRIAEAQKKRWAKQRRAAKKAA